MNSLPHAVRAIASRYKTQRGQITNSPESHDLHSLSRRLLLSPREALEMVSDGTLLALAGPLNGKYLFSSAALDGVRNRVVDFVARSIVNEMSHRGESPDRVCHALERAFARQTELARGTGDAVTSFAQNDDDDHDLRHAAEIAAGAGAGYLGYRAYKGRRNRGSGANALPGQPQLPPAPGGRVIDATNPKHPGPPGGGTLTSSAPPTGGSKVVDPLSSAVARGRKTITQRGSAIWKALRSIPLE